MTRLPEDIYKPTSEPQAGPRILILTANNVEDIELFYPYYRFIEAGLRVDIATPKGGNLKAAHGTGLKDTRRIADITPSDYQLIYIPGGKAPAELKDKQDAIRVTKQFTET